MELWIFALGVEFYEMALPKKCFGLKFGDNTIGNVTKQKSATLPRPDDLGQNKIKSLPKSLQDTLIDCSTSCFNFKWRVAI